MFQYGTSLGEMGGHENEIYLNLLTGNHKEKLNEQQKLALLYNNTNQHRHVGFSLACCFFIIHRDLSRRTFSSSFFMAPPVGKKQATITMCLHLQNAVLLWLADASWGSTNWAPGDTNMSGSVLRRFILPFIFFNIVAYGEGEVIGSGKKKTVQRKEKNLKSILKSGSHPHTYKILRILKKLQ